MSDVSDRLQERLGRAHELLESGDVETLQDLLGQLHPSDLADLVEDLDEDRRLQLVELLPPEVAADVLPEIDEAERPADLLARMDPGRIGEIVEDMADDDAADLIGELEPEVRARVLAQLSESEATEIEHLLHYAEDTAGGIMTREMVAVSSDFSASQAIDQIRTLAGESDDFYTIFVVDSDHRLRGVVALHRLVVADPSTPIAELLEAPAAVVPVDMDQEEVGRTLSKYNLASIGVVDPLNRLVGRVTFDDVIDVLEAETTEDILRFAAVSEEEELRGSTADAIRRRLPWLLTSLATALMGATVVWLFRDTISEFVLLAAAMPITAGVAGNAGTQALAVTIRRIALSDETLAERWRVLAKEVVVGLINGLVLGLVASLLAFVRGGLLFGLVVLLAMWGALVASTTLGAFIPILLESLGLDPAVASSPFVTSLTDMFGFSLLLGLASLILV